MSDKGYSNSFETANYDDVFFRDVLLGVRDEMNGRINWVNKFSDEDVKVDVPFYYTYAGGHEFMKDLYMDDVPGDRVNGNIDQIPRVHFLANGWSIAKSEQTNPYVYVTTNYKMEDGSIKKVTARLKSIPWDITLNFTGYFDSERDVMMYTQKYSRSLYPYREFKFEHNGIRLQAVIQIPESTSFKINRDISIGSDTLMTVENTATVKCYQPALSDIDLASKGKIRDASLNILEGDFEDRFKPFYSFSKNAQAKKEWM